MQTPASTQSPQSPSARGITRGSLTGGNPEMTPFAELPLDPNWPQRLRATIAAQPDEYFRLHFNGRLPSASEKHASIEQQVRLLTPVRVFQNNIYRVEIADTPHMAPTFVHLAIRRLDEGTCNEWNDLQRIKNEIVGPEYEAVELFPAESRLVNAGNEYHLWVHSDPNYRFPIGWAQRFVLTEPVRTGEGSQSGALSLDGAPMPMPIPVGGFTLSPPRQQA